MHPHTLQSMADELLRLSKTASWVRETRKAWSLAQSRSGRRPMRVDTLLRKEVNGTLGGYKFASLRNGFKRALHTMQDRADLIDVAGLGVLAAPSMDNMVAKARARRAGSKNVDKYRLINHNRHDAVELGGLGMLAAPMVAKRITTGSWRGGH